MEPLFRVFVLKELRGWEHETALVDYLDHCSDLYEQLAFETIPDQSTLWRSWHERFTADLRETVETAARTILIKARIAGVAVPRDPERKLRHHDDDREDSDPDDQLVLKQGEEITDHACHVVFPSFSLDRGEGCEIHENATGAYRPISGFVRTWPPTKALAASYTSRRGSGHHSDTLIATTFVISLSSRIVAIDITEADPFTGDRTGHEDEILGTKENTDEYAYQWATVQLVGNAVPLVYSVETTHHRPAKPAVVSTSSR